MQVTPERSDDAKLHRLLVQKKSFWKEEWEHRVSFFRRLDDALLGEPPQNVHVDKELLQVVFTKGLDDHHLKVLVEVYRALKTMLRVSSASLEPHFDQLLPRIFSHAGGKRGELQRAAIDTLDIVQELSRADVLLFALIKSLEYNKLASIRQLVLDFSEHHLGEGSLAGVPATAQYVRDWAARVAGLLADKHVSVRAAAARALMHVYSWQDHTGRSVG